MEESAPKWTLKLILSAAAPQLSYLTYLNNESTNLGPRCQTLKGFGIRVLRRYTKDIWEVATLMYCYDGSRLCVCSHLVVSFTASPDWLVSLAIGAGEETGKQHQENV